MKHSLLAFFGVVILFGAASCRKESAGKPDDVDYYTCTMHPSVRKQSPTDKCPICGMDLVPVKKKGLGPGGHEHRAESGSSAEDAPKVKESAEKESAADEEPREFTVPSTRLQQIGVTFSAVEARPLVKTIRAAGIVSYDKKRHWDYVSRVDGYVQKLFVFSRGEFVEENAPLLTLYSPELLTTQNEFIDLLKARDEAQRKGQKSILESSERLVSSAKERLRLWNISDEAINALEKTRKPTEQLTLYSPFKGVVQDIGVDQGRKVMSGDHLVDVADLSIVWIWAAFYQEDVSVLKIGSQAVITTSSYPGEKFNAKISLVDPFMNEAARTSRVRIDVENQELKLRPEMYVDVEITLDMGKGLTVPVPAVLPTGTRNIVFVDKGEGKLEPRFVELGRKFGDFYEVRAGLKESEKIVTSGNFLIDAEAKVQGALKSW